METEGRKKKRQKAEIKKDDFFNEGGFMTDFLFETFFIGSFVIYFIAVFLTLVTTIY